MGVLQLKCKCKADLLCSRSILYFTLDECFVHVENLGQEWDIITLLVL